MVDLNDFQRVLCDKRTWRCQRVGKGRALQSVRLTMLSPPPANGGPASTTVLTNVRFVDRSMDTFRSEPARLRRVPIATWRWNLLRDAAYAGAPRGRKPLGKAGISRGSRWAGVFFCAVRRSATRKP